MGRYKITVLQTGYNRAFPAGIPFDFWAKADETEYQSFTVTLIQGEGHNILFDCGFDMNSSYAPARHRMEGNEGCADTEKVLAGAGLKPSDIDSVILSHCHWDHMNGLGLFKDSKIYVQKEEVESWKNALASDSFPLTHKSVIDTDAFDALEDLDKKGHVVWLDGDKDDLFPWIDLKCFAGHSFAQSALFIDNGPDGHLAVIGDIAMRPESFTGTKEFPCFLPNVKFATGTIGQITDSYKKILDWVGGNVKNIYMSHDSSRKGTPEFIDSPAG